MFGEPINKKW